MIIMGLDQSITSTGYVILSDNDVIDYGCIPTTPNQFSSEIKRLLFIKLQVKLIMNTHRVHKVYMEGFAFGAYGASIFQIGGLGYLLRELFYEENIPLVIIPPSKVKKYITGKGNANKKMVVDAINKKWNMQFKLKDNDICDAWSLAQFGQRESSGRKSKKRII